MTPRTVKVSIVGGGELAQATALRLSEASPFDVVVYDRSRGGSGDKTRELKSSAAIRGHSATVQAASNPVDTAGSDILVMTPEPSESRSSERALSMDLESVIAWSDEPVIVVADSASGLLCALAQSLTGVSARRVIGTGTLPDSARLQVMFAHELGLSVQGVEALAIGRPGRSAIPIVRFATASGIPLVDLIGTARLSEIVSEFRSSGSNGVKSPTRESALAYAQVAAIERIVTAIGLGKGDLLPSTVMLNGEYGLTNVYLSVPAVLGPGGVEKVVELDLAMDELISLRRTASEFGAVPGRASP